VTEPAYRILSWNSGYSLSRIVEKSDFPVKINRENTIGNASRIDS